MAAREIRSVVLNIRIRPSLKELADKAADDAGLSLSMWIEGLIERAQTPPRRKGERQWG